MEDATFTWRGMETICQRCGHGSDLHTGDGSAGRPPGWCIACEDRRTAGERERIACSGMLAT